MIKVWLILSPKFVLRALSKLSFKVSPKASLETRAQDKRPLTKINRHFMAIPMHKALKSLRLPIKHCPPKVDNHLYPYLFFNVKNV